MSWKSRTDVRPGTRRWDKMLERRGLLRYQTKDLSDADVQARYERFGLQTDWASLGRQGGGAASTLAPALAPADQGLSATTAAGVGAKGQLPQAPKIETAKVPGAPDLTAGAYKPSFYENPRQITSLYHKLQTDPNTVLPQGMDRQSVEGIYNYFKTRNAGAPEQSWKYLNPQDPFVGYLQKIPGPGEQAGIAIPATAPRVPQPGDANFDWSRYPAWQRITFEVMSNPVMSGAAAGIPFGPAGIIIGAGLAGLGQKVNQAAKENPNNQAMQVGATIVNELMKTFMIPAQAAEQALGTFGQYETALRHPEIFGSPDNFDWKAAWNAASETWNVGAVPFFMKETPNLPIAIEAGMQHLARLAGITAPWVNEKLTYAKESEVWKLGESATPVHVPVITLPNGNKIGLRGLYALSQMRQEITNNPDVPPEEILQKYQQLYGFSGEMRDLATQIVGNPLNGIGDVETLGLAGLADIAKKPALAEAALTGKAGLFGALDTYKHAYVRSGIVPVDEMTWFDRAVGGISKEGKVLEWAKPHAEPSKAITTTLGGAAIGGAIGGIPGAVVGGVAAALGGSVVSKGIRDFFFGLSGRSKASVWADSLDNNVGVIFDQAGHDPAAFGELMKGIAHTDMENAAGAGAKYLGNPEIYTSLPLLREFVNGKLPGLTEEWGLAEPARTTIDRIAQVLGEKPEDLLARLRSPETDLPLEYQRLMEAALKSKEPDALRLVEAAKDKTFTPETLGDTVKVLEDVPYSKEAWFAKANDALGQTAADWMQKYYGLKPAGRVEAFFGIMKKVQSLALLSIFNPLYPLRNLYNNVVTRVAGGSFGWTTPGSEARLFERLGVEPARAGVGIGLAGDTGQVGAGGEKYLDTQHYISEMTRPTGRLGAVDTFLGKVSQTVGLTGKLSQAIERSNSRSSSAVGVRKMWSNLWRRNYGISEMPADLADALRAHDPALVDAVYATLEGTMNGGEIEAAIFKNAVQEKALRGIVVKAAQAMGEDPIHALDMLHQTGILDELQTRLETAKTSEQVYRVYQDVLAHSEKWVDDTAAASFAHQAEHIAGKVKTEGFAGAWSEWADMVRARQHRWDVGMQAWDDVFNRIQEIEDPKLRSELVRVNREVQSRAWTRTQGFERATILGMMKAFGFNDPQIREFEAALLADHEGWRNVYAEAEKTYAEHFDKTFKNSAEGTASWEITKNRVEKLFTDAFEQAAKRQEGMGTVLKQLFEKNFGEGKGAGAEKFYKSVGEQTRAMGQVMREIRAQVNEQAVTPAERNQLYRQLRDSRYVPMIHEYLDRLQGGLPRAIGEAVAPTVMENAPGMIGAIEARPNWVPPMQGWAEIPPDVRVPDGVETRVFADGATRGRLRDANLLPSDVRTEVETRAYAADRYHMPAPDWNPVEKAMTRGEPVAPEVLDQHPYLKAAFDQGAKEYPATGGLKITKAENLTPAQRVVEARFAESLNANLPGAIDQYWAARFSPEKNVLNIDFARDLSADYSLDPQNRMAYSAAVQKPASALIRKMFEQSMAEPLSMLPEENIVTFTAGGGGSGKTTATQTVPTVRDVAENSHLVWDMTLSEPKDLAYFDQVMKSGRRVEAVFVARNPIDALLGMADRAEVDGRTVPIGSWADAHAGSPETFRQAITRYKNNPNVNFIVVDNTRGLGNAIEVPTDFLRDWVYNSSGLKRTGLEVLKQGVQNGTIRPDIYQAITGDASFAGSGVLPESGVRGPAAAGQVGSPAPAPTGSQEQGQSVRRNALRGLGAASPEAIREQILAQAAGLEKAQAQDVRAGANAIYGDKVAPQVFQDQLQSLFQQALQPQKGEKLGNDYVFHNTNKDALAGIEKEGMSAGSFSDKPIDFGGDSWIAIRRDRLGDFQQQTYGKVTSLEPTWEIGTNPDGTPIYRMISPNDLVLVDKNGKVIRTLGQGMPSDVLYQDKPLYTPGVYDHIAGYMNDAEALSESWADHMAPLLEGMRHETLKGVPREFKVSDLPADTQDALRSYINQVKNVDMPTAKLQTVKFADYLRDDSLLNYNRRTPFGQLFDIWSPYRFWTTESMLKWAPRVIDNPVWFSTYARLMQFSNTYQRDIPERLRGKIRIALPFGPEWARGGLYVDPWRDIFPFVNFMQPLFAMQRDAQNQQSEAVRVIQEWTDAGTITKGQADQAINNRAGPDWERALVEAGNRREAEVSNPFDFMNMMTGPALYLSIPYLLATGHPEKISPTPLYRGTSAIQTALSGTPLEGIGKMIGMLGTPEHLLREQSMSDNIAKFGQYGEYYIDRQLANMAAEGLITAEQARIAILERNGPIYDQAMQRVQYEMMVKTPGMVALSAFANMLGGKAGPMDVINSIGPSLTSGALLPAGELEFRGQKQEWNAAWAAYDKGNNKAIDDFFNKYPEYKARLLATMRGTPEEKVRNFLIDSIWNGYMSLGPTDQRQAKAALGPEFDRAFLSRETRSYESVNTETLTTWAQMLHQQVPQTPETAPTLQRKIPQIQYISPAVADLTDQFFKTRSEKFPNYYSLQQTYYSLPKSERARFLLNFPEYARYRAWRDSWYKNHPDLKPILSGEAFRAIDTSAWPPALKQTMQMYALTGDRLPSGLSRMMRQVWLQQGEPYGDFNIWMNTEVLPGLRNEMTTGVVQ